MNYAPKLNPLATWSIAVVIDGGSSTPILLFLLLESCAIPFFSTITIIGEFPTTFLVIVLQIGLR